MSNEVDFPGSLRHGEAWRRFTRAVRGRELTTEQTQEFWLMFLAGWNAKIAQQQDIRRGRPGG